MNRRAQVSILKHRRRAGRRGGDHITISQNRSIRAGDQLAIPRDLCHLLAEPGCVLKLPREHKHPFKVPNAQHRFQLMAGLPTGSKQRSCRCIFLCQQISRQSRRGARSKRRQVPGFHQSHGHTGLTVVHHNQTRRHRQSTIHIARKHRHYLRTEYVVGGGVGWLVQHGSRLVGQDCSNRTIDLPCRQITERRPHQLNRTGHA